MLIPVIIRKDQTKPAITVWLDDDSEQVVKKFRCCVCGAVVFEYYDSVRMMVVGEVGYLHAPTIIMCKGKVDIETQEGMVTKTCKTLYYIAKR
ncbi:MAG: hypothetical protein A2Z42_03000 [Candidatus Woykebacteria bacterium RBG_19FT_COMBO_43_10]|uniref:Uncharacterized protein n=1 Tax=Candidatus Woykebacteria bacterium RBG_19FT_COMBO_43_10 TaxID=1802598 RepID=A0A1G1WL97_9BACT|nr:MAG: hypothetical protein A2Z42_03000 [Candidatus Woykebacteria bacterium RBG_19FT_COMBO_43_10]